VFNSVISLFYYFGVIRQMYLVPAEDKQPIKITAIVWLVIGVAAVVTLVLGIYPEPVIHLSRSLSLLFTNY
jgi:NADH-quinone oxidoreductase subunit N